MLGRTADLTCIYRGINNICSNEMLHSFFALTNVFVVNDSHDIKEEAIFLCRSHALATLTECIFCHTYFSKK